MTNKEMEMYDYLVETGHFTSEELNLARCLCNGSWEEILNSAIFARYGLRTYEALLEEEAEEE